ncbi:AfsR/SARP family transcriptional regulator [Nakamurella sp.]|uniref:AfsR/SARP family transcriptional regulator n=1 Tax=Nakamurella sp. TaxID=1869182 RepID=UPI003783A14B
MIGVAPAGRHQGAFDAVTCDNDAVLTVAVLGQLQLRRDGELRRVPAGKASELLVRLAVAAGTVVAADRLLSDLWSTPSSPSRNTLQAKVSQLRRALDGRDLLAEVGGGYVLRIDPERVDALEVARLAAAARAHLATGDARACVDDCDRALEMFDGPILVTAGGAAWADPVRARLEQTRLGLIEDRAAARLELGAAGDLVGELGELVEAHPLRERLWAMLMTALYRDGRQADALAAYRRIKSHLADELGIDPGPELQELERRVLAGDPTLAPIRVPVRPAAAMPDRPTVELPIRAGNLPGLAVELLGRDTDLGELAATLPRHRLVTLVGPAGVGKTSLAVEAARRHPAPGGCWLVRLEHAADPATVLAAVGEALSMVGPTWESVAERFRGTDALVVLDNCEHVVDAAADLVDRLLAAAAGLRILTTSQVPLDLAGEILLAVEPLSTDDAVALFVRQSARRRRSSAFDPDAVDAARDLCDALDRIPLAIELAAARTKALSVQEIAHRLDDRFALLSDPSGRRPDRHRGLAAAISWSYDLLFPDDQRVLWAIAGFTGGAPLAAVVSVASAVGVPEPATLDVVDRLADRSMVVVDVGTGGAVRYRLLESVRAYALDRQTEAGMVDAVRDAHLNWFTGAARIAAVELRGPRQSLHLGVARDERANIDAALWWAALRDPAAGLRIAVSFGWAWVVLGEGVGAAERLRRAVAATGEGAPAGDRATALALAGWNEVGGDVGRALAESERAVALADLAGDDAARTVGRFALAFALIHAGRAPEALHLLDRWRVTALGRAPDWDLALGAVLAGYAALAAGEPARAAAACGQAGPLLGALGDDWLVSHVESILGEVARADHRLSAAGRHLQAAADSAHRATAFAAEGFHLANLGRVRQLAGDDAGAAAALERGIAIIEGVGLMRALALSRIRLARVRLALGDRAGARTELLAADRWFRESGGGDEASLAAVTLAATDAEDGLAGAPERLAELLDTARSEGDVDAQVLALDATAALRAVAGDPAQARRILATADELMPLTSYRLADVDRRDARRAWALLSSS